MTRVTAMVPTYNGAPFVAETLASLAAQDHPELEIVVSDDASNDATLAICRRFAADDPRCRVIAQPHRLGWIDNCRSLMTSATTPLVFYAPQDDTYDPMYVSRCVAALAERPEAVLAYAATRWHKLDGSVVEITTPVAVSGTRVQRAVPYIRGRDPARWFAFRGVVHAEALRRVGGLRHGMAPEADGRLLMRLALEGPFAFVPELLVDKHQHADSTALTFSYRMLRRQLSLVPEILAADLSWREHRTLLAIDAHEIYRRTRLRYRRGRSIRAA
jgi:glycosyltransferase involved in cell wall biosynthesis